MWLQVAFALPLYLHQQLHTAMLCNPALLGRRCMLAGQQLCSPLQQSTPACLHLRSQWPEHEELQGCAADSAAWLYTWAGCTVHLAARCSAASALLPCYVCVLVCAQISVMHYKTNRLAWLGHAYIEAGCLHQVFFAGATSWAWGFRLDGAAGNHLAAFWCACLEHTLKPAPDSGCQSHEMMWQQRIIRPARNTRPCRLFN